MNPLVLHWDLGWLYVPLQQLTVLFCIMKLIIFLLECLMSLFKYKVSFLRVAYIVALNE